MRLSIASLLPNIVLGIVLLMPLSVHAEYTVYELPGQTFNTFGEAVAAARAISPAHNDIQLMETTPLSGKMQYQYWVPEKNATQDPWRYFGGSVSSSA